MTEVSVETQEKMADRANRQAAAMEPEQQKDGLNMGIDMFKGRIKLLFEDTAKNKSIPQDDLCIFVSVYEKNKIRYDIMRLTSREPVTYSEHVAQVKVHDLLGLPEFMVYVVKRKLTEAILESLKQLASAEKLPVEGLAFQINNDMQLALFFNQTHYKQLDLNQIIQKI